ncbi:hypothetical protein [Streptomyces bacillaris]|uniref:hypothetical protein n=1 Tax=Streptomyces bacillaris TaxID=68179 RepID=UPI0036343EE9
MGSKAQDAWDELNRRQQTYLTVLYRADQELAAERQSLGARGDWSSTPARVWRRISVNSYYSPVAHQLRDKGVYDSGAGATLAALVDRGLIESGHVDGVLSAWMTRPGRATARAGLGIRSWSKPKWALSLSMWTALTEVVAAGPGGLPINELWSSAHLYLVEGETARGNRGYLQVVKHHIEYTPWPTEYNPNPTPATRVERRYQLTEQGRAHYADRLEEYREMYDEVEALALPPV